MKLKLIAGIMAGMLAGQQAYACLADGAVDGAVFAIPQGTFEVAVAFQQAQQRGDVQTYANSNWSTVQFILMQKLQSHYQGEVFDITLFEATGQHFYRFVADGEQVNMLAHEVPKSEYQGIIVTDIDVMTALVRGQMDFANADKLGLFFNLGTSQEFTALMTKAFA